MRTRRFVARLRTRKRRQERPGFESETVESEVRRDIGVLLDELTSLGYRVISASYSPESFGNWTVTLAGPKRFRLTKERSQFIIWGDRGREERSLERAGLSQAFDDPEEFTRRVLAWAADG